MRDSIRGEATADPKLLRFTTGRRQAMWKYNCVAISLSAGVAEPLESTAVQLILKGVRSLIELFPDCAFEAPLQREYNRLLARDDENIRDFLVLDYCRARRKDTGFWQWCRQGMTISDSLHEKIDLFKTCGYVLRNPLKWVRTEMVRVAAGLPRHQNFITRYCRADVPGGRVP